MNKDMRSLINELNELSYEYYTLNQPSVSDETYDKLYDNLLKLEKEIPNKRIKNLKGKAYYDLVVIGYMGKNEKTQAVWLCKCICKQLKLVVTSDLKNGHTKSCGCRNVRMLQKRNSNNKYGEKHGLSRSRIYTIYQGMIQRCFNANSDTYKNYGKRGITICDEWISKDVGFINFYNWAISNGYDENLTIERIDVNGNYNPKNCTWITNKEQQNNKRTNVLISSGEDVLNMRQWSKVTGINEKTIEKRIRMGWKEEDLFKEVHKGKVTNSIIKEIINMYNDGYSARKIGDILNLSHTTISDYLAKYKKGIIIYER